MESCEVNYFEDSLWTHLRAASLMKLDISSATNPAVIDVIYSKYYETECLCSNRSLVMIYFLCCSFGFSIFICLFNMPGLVNWSNFYGLEVAPKKYTSFDDIFEIWLHKLSEGSDCILLLLSLLHNSSRLSIKIIDGAFYSAA
jgi:hypothetical protein